MHLNNSIKEKNIICVQQLKNLCELYDELLQDINSQDTPKPPAKEHKSSCIICTKLFLKKTLIIFIAITLLSNCTSPKKQAEEALSYRTELSAKLYKTRNKDSLQLFLQQFLYEKNDIATMLCYKEIGKHERENARFSDAIASHQDGLNIALKLKDTIEIVQALNNLGTDFRRIGALSEASNYHYSALRHAEAYSAARTDIGIKNRVIAMNGIGNISLLLGYYNDAEKYFRAALQDEIALNSPIGQAINLANIGSIFEKRQQYDSARIYYQRSLEQNMIGKSDMGIGLCLIHLGDLYKIEKMYDQAKAEYEKAYNLMENINDRWHWLEACLSIAEIHLLTNNLQNFNTYISMAEETAAKIKSPEHMASIYSLKHDYNLRQGNYAKALNNFKQSIAMNDSLQGMQKATHYMDLRVNHERNQNAHYLRQIDTQNKEKQRIIYISWFIFFMGVLITAVLYYAYRQRTRSNKILKQIEQDRSDFFTNITHEFRTPLTVIQGLNGLLYERKNLLNKEKAVYHIAIDRQSNNLLNLVNQLLDIARLKAGKDAPEWKHGDIISYLHMTAETFRLFAEEKKINLIFYSEFKSQDIDFIPFYIDKIVSNLLSNAIKYTKAGDKINFIVVKGTLPGTIIIRVTDNGEGIPKEDLEHIFEMFYQSRNSINIQGTGIGLSFTRMMVEKMNGKITVESQLGKGSAFTIVLPLKNKNLNKIALNEKQMRPYLSTQKAQPKTLFKTPEDVIHEDENNKDVNGNFIQPIVLVVEDNKDIAVYIKALIGDKYNVIIALNGQEGIEMAEKHIPDLVLTDVMMPVKDGYQLCYEMKQHELLNHIPIIMLTAKSADEDRIEGLRCGVEAYIRKPFQQDELFLRIEKILENRRLLKEKYIETIAHNSSENNKLDSNANLKFLQTVTNIIHAEMYNSALNSAFLADKMAMSISQLNRKFNGIAGCSAISYVLQVKLAKAKKMLNGTNVLISEVADTCGFYDVSYFSRVFKKEFGITPSQYQKMPMKEK